MGWPMGTCLFPQLPMCKDSKFPRWHLCVEDIIPLIWDSLFINIYEEEKRLPRVHSSSHNYPWISPVLILYQLAILGICSHVNPWFHRLLSKHIQNLFRCCEQTMAVPNRVDDGCRMVLLQIILLPGACNPSLL